MMTLNLTLTVLAFAFCAGCNRQSDFITETDPFFAATMKTPTDGKVAIAARGSRFASKHAMKVHFVPNHFEPHEYSLSLTRADLNISADNVQKGASSVVRAYATNAPSSTQRAEVTAYLCEVMRNRCAS